MSEQHENPEPTTVSQAKFDRLRRRDWERFKKAEGLAVQYMRERDDLRALAADATGRVSELIAERDEAVAQRDKLKAALRDAIPIMWSARKSEWHEHDRALKRFDRDHAGVLAGLEEA